MKNKSATYILLTGVLIVWGLVFYKIFSGLGSDDVSSFEIPQKRITNSSVKKEEEVFVLLANYRDPFIGGTSRALPTVSNFSGNNSFTSSNKVKKTIVKKEEVVVDWKFLDYIGIVYNKETQKKVGLLVISGKEYMVNDKDVINEVTILRKERDSIQVEYKGIKKWLTRN